jgi:putative membrane protein
MQQQTQQPDQASQGFIKTAIEGNNAEIEVGKLAQQKGQSDAVKQYGAMLVKDHSEANTKAQQVARQLNVEPPTGTSLGQKATYAKLKVLSGASFDKSFANSMVSDHQSDIKDYQEQTKKADPAGNFAKEILPTLQKHLQEAQQLSAQLNQKQSSR